MKKGYCIWLILFWGILLLGAVPADGSKKAKPQKNLRILYWNIQNGMWAGQFDNYDAFIAWVKSKDPDICIFCEAASFFRTDSVRGLPKEQRYLPKHFDEFCRRYGHSYSYVSPIRGKDHYPQAVTSKFPITALGGGVGVKPDTVINHAYGWCQVEIPGVKNPLNITTVHLLPTWYGYPDPAKGVKDKAEAKRIRRASIDNCEGDLHRVKEVTYIMNHTIRTHENGEKELWIMAGDFNCRSRKDNFRYKYSSNWPYFIVSDYMNSPDTPYYDLVSEMYPETFCPSHVNGMRIDYIYVTKPVLKSCRNVITKTDDYTKPKKAYYPDGSKFSNFYTPSDHFPTIIDLNISKLK